MVQCAIADCKNSHRVRDSNSSLSFHNFPQDNQKLAKEWLLKCKRKDTVNMKYAVVCSVHFTPEDFELDFRKYLMGWNTKRKLKPGSVPSKLLPKAKSTIDTPRQGRAEKRKRNELVQNLIDYSEQNMTETSPNCEAVLIDQGRSPSEYEAEINALRSELVKRDLSTERISAEYEARIHQLKCNISLLNRRNEYLGKEQKRREEGKKQHTVKELNLMKNIDQIFSSTQLKKLSGKKVQWQVDDIARALVLKTISPKAYETVRSVWNFPLPSIRTLANWAQNFKCRSGILSDVLQVLKAKGEAMDEFSKLCVLNFDEMSVSSEIVWDKSLDSVIGPYSHAQVVLLFKVVGVKYILTSRLLQDATESLFSVIRSFGRTHDQPDPYQFRCRFRLILLGSKIRAPTSANVKFDHGAVSFVSSKLLEGVSEIENNDMTDQNKQTEAIQNSQMVKAHIPPPLTRCKDDNALPANALGYLAGYIAYVVKKRTKKVFGAITRKTPLADIPRHSRNELAWIYALSRGGLLTPNEEMLESVKKCERMFCKVVPSHTAVAKVDGISEKLGQAIKCQYPGIDSDIIRFFIKTRLAMRIKWWNKQRIFAKRNAKEKVKSSIQGNCKPNPKTRNAKKVQHFIKSSKTQQERRRK